jgi:predicted permease
VWYLVPALKAAAVADKPERRILAAHALLLMSVILVILMLALLLTFRIGRFLFPTPTKRTKTQYTDAWAESAKRMRTPPKE